MPTKDYNQNENLTEIFYYMATTMVDFARKLRILSSYTDISDILYLNTGAWIKNDTNLEVFEKMVGDINTLRGSVVWGTSKNPNT